MIGVAVNPTYHSVIREFFELFKTPWEFYRSGRQYELLLGDGTTDLEERAARVVLIFAAETLPCDSANQVDKLCRGNASRFLVYKGFQIPIYGSCITFPGREQGFLVDAGISRNGGIY